MLSDFGVNMYISGVSASKRSDFNGRTSAEKLEQQSFKIPKT